MPCHSLPAEPFPSSLLPFLFAPLQQVIERLGVQGHVFSVLDEHDRLLPASSLSVTVDGQKFSAKRGDKVTPSHKPVTAFHQALPDWWSWSQNIVVPFATSSSTKTAIVTLHEAFLGGAEEGKEAKEEKEEGEHKEAAGSKGAAASDDLSAFSTLYKFTREKESYTLHCGFFLDRFVAVPSPPSLLRQCLCRESLVQGNRTATLILRPQLMLLDRFEVSCGVLEDVTVDIRCVDMLKASSERGFKNVKVCSTIAP